MVLKIFFLFKIEKNDGVLVIRNQLVEENLNKTENNEEKEKLKKRENINFFKDDEDEDFYIKLLGNEKFNEFKKSLNGKFSNLQLFMETNFIKYDGNKNIEKIYLNKSYKIYIIINFDSLIKLIEILINKLIIDVQQDDFGFDSEIETETETIDKSNSKSIFNQSKKFINKLILYLISTFKDKDETSNKFVQNIKPLNENEYDDFKEIVDKNVGNLDYKNILEYLKNKDKSKYNKLVNLNRKYKKLKKLIKKKQIHN